MNKKADRNPRSLHHDKTRLNRVTNEAGHLTNAKAGHEFRAVSFNSLDADLQRGCNLLGAAAFTDHLQDFALSPNGLVANIVSFNIGVEIGQILALTYVLIVLSYWRTRPSYLRHAYFTNAALMSAGFVFTGYQMAGYFVSRTTS